MHGDSGTVVPTRAVLGHGTRLLVKQQVRVLHNNSGNVTNCSAVVVDCLCSVCLRVFSEFVRLLFCSCQLLALSV